MYTKREHSFAKNEALKTTHFLYKYNTNDNVKSLKSKVKIGLQRYYV